MFETADDTLGHQLYAGCFRTRSAAVIRHAVGCVRFQPFEEKAIFRLGTHASEDKHGSLPSVRRQVLVNFPVPSLSKILLDKRRLLAEDKPVTLERSFDLLLRGNRLPQHFEVLFVKPVEDA